MVQQVLLPNQKESDLDTILKGLQIAATGYGLYADTQKLDLMKQQQDAANKKTKQEQDEKDRLARGEYNKGEIDQVGIAGGRYSYEAPKDMTGVISAKIQTPQGLKDVFITPKSELERISAQKIADAKTIDDKNKETKDDNKYVLDKVNQFKNDKRVLDLTGKASAARNVEWLLSQKKPNLDQAAQTAIFKMSGDVGAVRQEDRDAFSMSPALQAQAQATLNKLANGEVIAPEERANLQRWTDVILYSTTRDLNKLSKTEAKNISTAVRMNEEDVLSQIDPHSLIPERFPMDPANPLNASDAPRAGVSSPNMLEKNVSKPPVVQNGHTYYWNPQTGKYE